MGPTAAFDFLARPPRSTKPRKRGLSVVSDKARSLAEAAGIVEVAGDIIDHMKLPDHVGLMWRYPPELIRKKNELYVRAGIDTLPGWIAHWKEMSEAPATKIARPRQIYTGPTVQHYVPLDERR